MEHRLHYMPAEVLDLIFVHLALDDLKELLLLCRQFYDAVYEQFSRVFRKFYLKTRAEEYHQVMMLKNIGEFIVDLTVDGKRTSFEEKFPLIGESIIKYCVRLEHLHIMHLDLFYDSDPIAMIPMMMNIKSLGFSYFLNPSAEAMVQRYIRQCNVSVLRSLTLNNLFRVRGVCLQDSRLSKLTSLVLTDNLELEAIPVYQYLARNNQLKVFTLRCKYQQYTDPATAYELCQHLRQVEDLAIGVQCVAYRYLPDTPPITLHHVKHLSLSIDQPQDVLSMLPQVSQLASLELLLVQPLALAALQNFAKISRITRFILGSQKHVTMRDFHTMCPYLSELPALDYFELTMRKSSFNALRTNVGTCHLNVNNLQMFSEDLHEIAQMDRLTHLDIHVLPYNWRDDMEHRYFNRLISTLARKNCLQSLSLHCVAEICWTDTTISQLALFTRLKWFSYQPSFHNFVFMEHVCSLTGMPLLHLRLVYRLDKELFPEHIERWIRGARCPLQTLELIVPPSVDTMDLRLQLREAQPDLFIRCLPYVPKTHYDRKSQLHSRHWQIVNE